MSNVNISLFAQLLRLVDNSIVRKRVKEHQSDKHSKKINTRSHLVAMLFCHLAKADSLREISNGLRSATGNLIHFGVKFAPSKSSMSYINKHRSWKVFRDIYFDLLKKYGSETGHKKLLAPRLRRKIFIMDATLISVCLNLFDWAQFRRLKGALKLHMVLSYELRLPTFIHLTEGRKSDIVVAEKVNFAPGSVLVVDRGYQDFAWFNKLDSNNIYFVTRLKSNVKFTRVRKREIDSDLKDRIYGDWIISLTTADSKHKYPKTLRRICVWDEKNHKAIYLLTNNMYWTAETVSQLYQARWEIEVFFKQIKQKLKIKTFVGVSPNAVLIQIWTAMIVTLLLKYLQRKAQHAWTFSGLVSFLRLNLFVKIDLWQWLNQPYLKTGLDPPSLQLKLF